MTERRTERASSAVTPTERIALETVARTRNITVSELLRVMGVDAAVAEYTRLLEILPQGVA